MSKGTKLDATFSIMKGIAIISVVVGHAIDNDRFVNQYLLSFKVVSLLYFLWYDKPTELLATFPNIRNIGLEWTILYIAAGVFLPLLPTLCYSQIKNVSVIGRYAQKR